MNLATLSLLLGVAYMGVKLSKTASIHPQSPCPSVFSYEGLEPEHDHWYGVILVSTDESLVGVRLDIRFDRPVQLLVSWMGEVTSKNNERFTILSLSQKLLPGPPLSSRFMVKYNARLGSPQLRSVRLNGRQICPPDPNFPISLSNSRYQTTEKPTKRPDPAFNVNHYISPETIDVVHHHHHHHPEIETSTTSSHSFNNVQPGNLNTNINYGYESNFPKETAEDTANTRPNRRPANNNNNNKDEISNTNTGNNNPTNYYNGMGNSYETTSTYVRTSTYKRIATSSTTTTTEKYSSYGDQSEPPYNGYKDTDITKKNPNHNSGIQQTNHGSNSPEPNTNKNYNQPNFGNPSSGNKGNNSSVSSTKKPNQSKPNQSYSGQNSGGSSSNSGSKGSLTTQRAPSITTTERYNKTNQSTDYNIGYDSTKYHNNQHNKESSTSKYYYQSSPKYDTNSPNNKIECGAIDRTLTTVSPAPAPLITNGQNTARGQWPWHIALYKIDRINLSYVCGGTLVTSTAVITAAHCVTKKLLDRPVDPDVLVIYLGKYHLLQFSDDEGVQNKQVKEVHVHPKYNSTNYSGDIAVLILTSPAEYTLFVRPCCLWRGDHSVIGKEGTVVGWGFDENNHVTEELKMAKMPVVSQETCVNSYPEFFSRFTSDKTFCAGFRTGTTVCNGDSGGGMVFIRDSKWQLRGLVSITVAKEGLRVCDTNHYVVFTDVLRYIDWIDQYIS